MVRLLLIATIIPIYVIYKIYKLIDNYRFDKIQEQYFVEKSELQKAEYKKEEKESSQNINNKNDHLYVVTPEYKKQDYVMEYAELIFYKELKKITDKKGWVIFPQVTLYSIVSVNDRKRFQKLFKELKGRSIDFVICDENNLCKVVMCIELDGSIHNKPFKLRNDEFKDELFNEVGIKFVRIKKQNKYNLEELSNQLGIADDEKKHAEVSYFSTSNK